MDYLVEEMLRQLKITDIGELYNHEDIIPSNLLRLKEAMLNIGQQVDPLIVDEKSKVILDGNHRVKVLEMIKCPRTVCQIVDYSRKDITIGTWLPVSETLTAEELGKKGFRCESVEFDAGLQALNNKKAPFMLVRKEAGKKKCVLVNASTYSLDDMVEEQKAIMERLDDAQFRYCADGEGEELVNKGNTALYRKSYTKDEIIARAHARRPFPPKSTRHVIPNRIIRLNMRLGWLHEGAEEARKYLERMMHERIYNGNVRRYLEPVIVIY